jgi:hypothetical protein
MNGTGRRANLTTAGRQVTLAALGYADLGLRVVPIRAGRRHPPMDDWPNAATSDHTVIRSWWNGPYRSCGVGIVTGPGSQVWVLDVDVKNGKQGDVTLAALEEAHGPLPDTVEAVTGSGGRHLFFTWNPDHAVRNDQSGRVGEGLDVRGEGGQVVAAPTLHPDTGRPYRWRLGRGPGQIPFAAAPRWLYTLLDREPDQPASPPPARTTVPADLTADSPAAWFNATTTWSELLTRDGWTLARCLPSGEQRWTRPGKTPRQGVSATVGHAGRDILKVFTSSIPGLHADRAYTRFGYEAAVHHHGDRSALASTIRRRMPASPRSRLSAYARRTSRIAPGETRATSAPVVGTDGHRRPG